MKRVLLTLFCVVVIVGLVVPMSPLAVAQPPASSSLITFRSYRDGNYEIYVMNADGTNQRNLTNNPAEDSRPAWSPDGKYIAFHTTRDGNLEIYVMNSDGTNQRRLTNNPASDDGPAWSPDGTSIGFQTNRDGNYEIYVMDADGTNPRRLSNNLADDIWPAWSPDSKYIVFTFSLNWNWEIYVMNADGSNRRNLTNNPAADATPAWEPAPTPSNGGGGCFIATSALGPDDGSVDTLRAFRDSHLATNGIGSGFISAYYKLSPPVAEFIDDHPALKPVVRAALLPAVGVSEAGGMSLVVKMSVVAAMLLVSAMAVVWVRRRSLAGGF